MSILGKALVHRRNIIVSRNLRFSSWSQGQDPSSLRVNKFHSGLFIQPHPAKVQKGGEDAASITGNLIAVADGVGGWAESGVDPAKYSRQLCSNIDRLVEADSDGARFGTDPKRLLIDAESETREIGSCTCCIAALDRHEPFLHTCNLGDSGYLLLRKSGLDLVSVFRSKEQTHSFNFPY